MKVKLTFLNVEYITFTREVTAAELEKMDTEPGALFDALDDRFADDSTR